MHGAEKNLGSEFCSFSSVAHFKTTEPGTSPVGEKKNLWRRFCNPSPQFINHTHKFLNCSLGLTNRAHGLIKRTHTFPIRALRFCKPYPRFLNPYPQIHNRRARFRNPFPPVCKLTDLWPRPHRQIQPGHLGAGCTIVFIKHYYS